MLNRPRNLRLLLAALAATYADDTKRRLRNNQTPEGRPKGPVPPVSEEYCLADVVLHNLDRETSLRDDRALLRLGKVLASSCGLLLFVPFGRLREAADIVRGVVDLPTTHLLALADARPEVALALVADGSLSLNGVEWDVSTLGSLNPLQFLSLLAVVSPDDEPYLDT